MHFWIDKRSQTCGFSGRHRIPSSISSGGFGRRGAPGLGLGLCSSTASRSYCHTPPQSQSHIKLMVTPVHRFQSVECVAANAARHHLRPHNHSTHPHSHPHPARQPTIAAAAGNVLATAATHSHHLPSPSTYNGSQQTSVAQTPHSVELDSGVFLDLPLDGSSRGGDRGPSGAPSSAVTPDPISSHHHHGPHPNHHQHHVLPAAGKLKCGMWASFAIVTVFMAGAKFYFNNQSTGMEVLIFCSLLVVVLFAGCTVSLCEAVTSTPPSAAAAAAIMEAAVAQAHAPIPPEAELSAPGSTEELSPAAHAFALQLPPAQSMIHPAPLPGQTEPPPPPYHIAVMLPQTGTAAGRQLQLQLQLQNRRQQQQYIIVDDSPPPSYDKAVS